MLFDMSGSGEIQRLYYPEDEDAVALTLKKILLGTLSSRLVVSESQRTAGARWAYRVNETGHESWSVLHIFWNLLVKLFARPLLESIVGKHCNLNGEL